MYDTTSVMTSGEIPVPGNGCLLVFRTGQVATSEATLKHSKDGEAGVRVRQTLRVRVEQRGGTCRR